MTEIFNAIKNQLRQDDFVPNELIACGVDEDSMDKKICREVENAVNNLDIKDDSDIECVCEGMLDNCEFVTIHDLEYEIGNHTDIPSRDAVEEMIDDKISENLRAVSEKVDEMVAKAMNENMPLLIKGALTKIFVNLLDSKDEHVQEQAPESSA